MAIEDKVTSQAIFELAGDAQRAGFDLVAILTMISAALKLWPQIKQIIDQIKTVVPKPDATPDGAFPSAK